MNMTNSSRSSNSVGLAEASRASPSDLSRGLTSDEAVA
jgi:hypothetical protein